MLTENEIKDAFCKTNTEEPLGEGWLGLLRFGREVERVTKLDDEARVMVTRLTTERNNAEKREFEIRGRANALEERLNALDKLFCEAFANALWEIRDTACSQRDVNDV